MALRSLLLAILMMPALVFAQTESAHLELPEMDFKITQREPLTVEGGIVFENQGGAALTIRGLTSGTARTVEITKTSKFLWFFTIERPVDLIRVNANSVKEITPANGYTVRFTDFPDGYGNPGITTIYIDLGPDNDPNGDVRGHLEIVRYDKTPPAE